MAQLKAGVGASDTLFQHSRPNNPKRSRFDLSRITNFTADAGMIIPFDWFFCLPGDDVDIDFEYILDTLPLVSPSLTQYKVVTHWYSIDCKDLWEGWETFITRGRSGNINLSIPQIDLQYPLLSLTSFSDYKEFDLPLSDIKLASGSSLQLKGFVLPSSHHSLPSFLGCPPSRDGFMFLHFDGESFSPISNWEPDSYYYNKFYPYSLVSSALRIHTSSTDYNINPTVLYNLSAGLDTGLESLRYVSALPFMAYQNIVKYNYVSQNLLQGNTALFPEKGDHDWFLPYEAATTNYVGRANNTAPSEGFKFRFDGVYTNEDNCVRLDCLRYAQFDDDYFTSGLPWLQRGIAPSIDVDVDLSENTFADLFDTSTLQDLMQIGVNSNYSTNTSFIVNDYRDFNDFKIGNGTGSFLGLVFEDSQSRQPTGASVNFKLKPFIDSLKSIQAQSIGGQTSLTVNQLREMLAMQVWQERNARVDGSYNAMIYQHWQSNPHGLEHKPHYIGGTADYVNFATILQSSQSTSDSPLGSSAGRGSTGGNAKVGHYHANDYSYVMGVMIIKPVTTYQQGVERHLTQKVFEDFVQPEFEGLSPEPIYNQELYVSSTSSDNTDLFAYQERYVYLKVRQNVNRGLFQTSPEKDRLFGSFTQARWFKEKPVFSYQFLCMSPDNMRRDWLAYPSQPAFKIQAGSKVFVTRSLSYNSEPNTFGF